MAHLGPDLRILKLEEKTVNKSINKLRKLVGMGATVTECARRNEISGSFCGAVGIAAESPQSSGEQVFQAESPVSAKVLRQNGEGCVQGLCKKGLGRGCRGRWHSLV